MALLVGDVVEIGAVAEGGVRSCHIVRVPEAISGAAVWRGSFKEFKFFSFFI